MVTKFDHVREVWYVTELFEQAFLFNEDEEVP